MDLHIAIANRSQFARVAIEMDLSKPLLSKFRVAHFWQSVEYEGIPFVCFHCGRYGHRTITCSAKQKVMVENTQQASKETTTAQVQTPVVKEPESKFKPWMIAQRKGRRPMKPEFDDGQQLVSLNTNDGVAFEKI
ncbi:hypothetical protein Syun_022982 [Stephania yunnanensis]|uniref:CCHC-type domain-containing protein n=1 Tax=Stephania yunnanensis TaxID=152371 RepID=A0AAP0F838_9MAGN